MAQPAIFFSCDCLRLKSLLLCFIKERKFDLTDSLKVYVHAF